MFALIHKCCYFLDLFDTPTQPETPSLSCASPAPASIDRAPSDLNGKGFSNKVDSLQDRWHMVNVALFSRLCLYFLLLKIYSTLTQLQTCPAPLAYNSTINIHNTISTQWYVLVNVDIQ